MSGIFVAEQVESLRRRGLTIDVLVVNGAAGWGEYLRGFGRVRRAVRAEDYDLIHAHYVFSGIMALAQRRVPVLLTQHGIETQRGWTAPLCRWTSRHVARTIVTSRRVRDALGRADAEIVPCGVDTDLFRPMPRAEVRSLLGLDPHALLVLFAGMRRPEKRFDLVEAAVGHLQATEPTVELVVAEAEPHERMPLFMNACDVLVLASEAEGSPMVIKEAMACNLPIVSVDVGDVAEIIGGTAGCYLARREPADLAAQIGNALSFGGRTAGRDAIMPLSLDVIAARLERVYRECSLAKVRNLRKATKATNRRLCIITHSGYPVEPRARRMAEALIGQGYSVDVLCLRLPDQPAEEVVNGVRVMRLPVTRHQGAGSLMYLAEYARFFLLATWRLSALHRRHPYALVQVHNPPDALVFCTLPLKLGRVPVILDLRELTPELFMSRFGLARHSAVVRILTLLERWACRYASAALVLHERHRRIMTGRGIPDGRLIEVMNCPDEGVFDPAKAPLSRDGLPVGQHATDGRFVVIHHGGMMQRYGVDLLVRAVASVRDQIPGLQLELYGTGDFRPEIERLVTELGLAEVVTFHGQQPLETIPQAIAAADVGVAPMRQDVFTDCGLPTKLLEYVALGVPAITSRTATTADHFDDGMVQFFRPGDAGDLAQKLLTLYRDPGAARAQAARARRFTEAHNWPGERARYLDLVEHLTRNM